MTWLFLALGAAFCESCKDVASKSGLRQVDAVVAAWAFSFFSLPFLLPLLLLLEMPELGGEFWLALVIGGGLNLLALLLFMKAIQASDLSAAVPLIAFTPLFLLLTSPLLVGEFPGSWGSGRGAAHCHRGLSAQSPGTPSGLSGPAAGDPHQPRTPADAGGGLYLEPDL